MLFNMHAPYMYIMVGISDYTHEVMLMCVVL